MADRLRVGISPPWGLFDRSPREQRTALSSIADSGIDHLFVADHVSFRGGAGSDGVVQLAALAGIEPRLDLYLGVFLLALRHPVVAARQLATLASAAPGRLTVGVGVGGEDRHEFEVCEIDPTTRGRRTDAALEIVRRLLTGETVDWVSPDFTLRNARIRPAPDPPLRFVVGGRSDAALVRAGRQSSGWLAAWCSSRRMAEGIGRVEQIAADAGRTVDWSHGVQLWVGVGPDRATARDHVADGLRRFYKLPFEPFERYTPCGPAAAIAEFLIPYIEAGATTLNLTPVGPDRAAEVETIAEVRHILTARSAHRPS